MSVPASTDSNGNINSDTQSTSTMKDQAVTNPTNSNEINSDVSDAEFEDVDLEEPLSGASGSHRVEKEGLDDGIVDEDADDDNDDDDDGKGGKVLVKHEDPELGLKREDDLDGDDIGLNGLKKEEDVNEQEQLEDQGDDQGEGDEEDGEEDEDDDDDDDDEDEVSRKRKKRRSGGNQFLDVEAEVDDEDEEEEDEEDELLRQEFLADDQHLESVENEASRSHRKLDRSREKLAEQDAQALADQFKARYGRSASSRYMGSTQNISQRLLLPSVDDPLIWGVRVRNGKEKELVRQVYARMLNLKGTEGVYSVFQRDNFQGYIYIEAVRMDAVNHILSGLPGIYNNVGKVLVPIEEYPDLLRPGRSQESRLKPGSYVRIKTGKYKGDLGIVDNLAENDLEARIKLIPRLDYGRSNTSIIDPTTGKKKILNFNSKFRPPQRLFSDIEAAQYDREHLTTAKRDRNYYIYRNEEYINGFLYKDIKLSQLETQNIKPTLHELTLFNSVKDSDGIDLQTVASTLKNADLNAITFQPNDRVEITSGEQSKMKGRVLSIAEAKIARVLLEGNEEYNDVNNTIVEVPTTSLRKIFLPGDHVTIIHGAHKDESGLIVNIKDNQVTLVSDQTKKDIRVFPNYLVTSTDSSNLSSKVGRFELHQMVNLSANRVGIIIKAEKEIFKILCTDGRVLDLPPKNIVSALEINRLTEKTTDRNGLEIKVGDVVKEVGGEKRQGNIMHIYKSYLFLHSKSVYENTGIFVTDSNSVQTIASKGSISSSFKGPDLTKMNPNRMMAPPPTAVINQSRFGGRDMTLNQHVSVRKGPYKGKKGIIKDASGDVARVEMHNPAKIIPINKSDLLFELRPGQYVPYEQFLENYRGRNGGGSFRQSNFHASHGRPSPHGSYNNAGYSGGYNNGMNPRMVSNGPTVGGGKTPSWSSGAGGKTPAWESQQGGKTPSWSSNSGGKTPAWGSSTFGGKTPAWSSSTSGGKTPAWGSSTSGGKTPAWGSSTSGGKTPSWSSGAGGKTPSWTSNGSKTPAWGNGGNKSVWGGADDSNGGNTEYGNLGDRSVWGGQSRSKNMDWGAASNLGDWDAPNTSSTIKKEED
ncbi:hypothetical protein CAS74_000643 [Pichia kudriavzevii]|uniref:Chromatin elongation factor SPT5 n=1 Tax=Pichia kudriavzevii TaxID=4909 RepID=A0A1Z8JUI1_PICKU|nr:hypothetical protein CAS74_000643 [Pichia kudriavzevii]